MPSHEPKVGYKDAVKTATAIIAASTHIKNKDQRRDLTNEAAKMFWYAARASAFSYIRDNCKNMLKDGDPEEVLQLASTAVDNLDKLNAAVDRLKNLTDLFDETKAKS